MITKARLFLAFLLLAALAGSHTFVFYWGKSRGEHTEEVACKDAAIDDLNALINSTKTLTAEANSASLKLGKSINQRLSADAKTTQELRRALSESQHLRIDCVFDDGVMRKLETAADRADAATTGGLDARVPAGTEAE